MPWSDTHPVGSASFPHNPGVYKVFLAQAEGLAGTPLAVLSTGALLYVGKAEKGLRSRDLGQHLTSGRTGSSALRRSLGAVLRQELGLKARPRNDGRIANYRFDPVGEDALTAWMLRNLSIAWLVCESAAQAKEMEPGLIRESRPVLNDTDNPNGEFVGLIRRLREECRREAQAHLC